MNKPSDHLSPSQLLDTILDHLEGGGTNRKQALKAGKELVLRLGMDEGASQTPANRLLALTLRELSKNCLTGDPEHQSLVGRLAGQLESGEAWHDSSALQEQLVAIIQWLHQAVNAPPSPLTTPEMLRPLLKAIKTLGTDQAWIGQEVDQLEQQLDNAEDPEFRQQLTELCRRILEKGRERQEQIDRERRLFMSLVTDLANRIQDIRQQTGNFDHHMGDTIVRIMASRTIDDLEQLREVLVKEVEELKANTHQITRKLVESEQRLQETQGRMREMEKELARTRSESLTDPLTGIANRRAFDSALQKEMGRSLRYGEPLSLVMFDLDHFKKVNDSYGHPVGDKVLSSVAGRLHRLLRQSDFPARYGGEEFALILPETDLEEAAQVAEKVRQDIARLRFKTGSALLQVTASFGVAELAPQITTPIPFIEAADKALYRAKQQGRNRVLTAPVPGRAS